MQENYEISSSTLAIVPINNNLSKVLEEDGNYHLIMKSTIDIIDDSCKFFGSSYIGRHEGTKNLIGINYKTPIIIEETMEMIFFPTSSPKYGNCYWIALKHIQKCERENQVSKVIFKNGILLDLDISYSSLQNQILRSTLLEYTLRSRKKMK